MDKKYDYNFNDIEKYAIKKFNRDVVVIIISALALISSVLSLIFWSDILPVFIFAAILLVASIIFLTKTYARLSKLSLEGASGKIEHVHLDIKHVNQMKTASFSLQRAKYSSYWRAENRLTLFIKDGNNIHPYQLNNIPKKLVDYYEEKGYAVHIKGTAYPVRIDNTSTEWLCPICGSFNNVSSTLCSGCSRKILK